MLKDIPGVLIDYLEGYEGPQEAMNKIVSTTSSVIGVLDQEL